MKNGRRGPTWNSNSRRLREIEIIIQQRYGVLPVTDDVDTYLVPVAIHMREMARRTLAIMSRGGDEDRARLSEATRTQLTKWSTTWVPGLAGSAVWSAVAEACATSSVPRAQALGRRLRLTYADRQAWGITTIGSCDRTKKQRTADYMDRKRERDRTRAAQARKQAGRQSRAEWEARSKARTEPWKALGISRRTYYRRLAAGGTGPSPSTTP